jgi:holo-[acyl-carrier protein] synthase
MSDRILGHGVDLAAIQRFREILQRKETHFLERVFSAGEREYCLSRGDPAPSFAARFAAKEAYGKALGLGLGASGDFTEIEVFHDERLAPHLRLSGRALTLFQEFGGSRTLISLSHENEWAMASVIIVGREKD